MTLGEPLGWDRVKFERKIRLQDEALEELHIPTYNGFSEFLFWDVLQSLCKVYMVNLELENDRKIRKKALLKKLEDPSRTIDDIEQS
jgi:hypothetical protein